MVWHKKFVPAQNILGPVKGQGIIEWILAGLYDILIVIMPTFVPMHNHVLFLQFITKMTLFFFSDCTVCKYLSKIYISKGEKDSNDKWLKKRKNCLLRKLSNKEKQKCASFQQLGPSKNPQAFVQSKVRTFWETHKIWKNLPDTSKAWGRLRKFLCASQKVRTLQDNILDKALLTSIRTWSEQTLQKTFQNEL